MSKWSLVLLAACVMPHTPAQRAAPTPIGPPIPAAAPAVAEMPELPETESGLFSKGCEIVQKAIGFWETAQAGYDALEPEAEAKQWDAAAYDHAVALYINAHLGYAITWFALTATLIVFYIMLGLRTEES